MTELNATDWTAYADGSSPQATYVQDDTSRKQVGAASVKFVTDGGFDTYIRYPRDFTALWSLCLGVQTLNLSVYAVNPNGGFQNGSPWIRLKDADGDYFQYQYYQGGGAYDILNNSRQPLANVADSAGCLFYTRQWLAMHQRRHARPLAHSVPGDPRRHLGQRVHVVVRRRLFHPAAGAQRPQSRWPSGLSRLRSVQSLPHRPERELLPPPAGCAVVDYDGDGDVDQADFGVFQRCLRAGRACTRPGLSRRASPARPARRSGSVGSADPTPWRGYPATTAIPLGPARDCHLRATWPRNPRTSQGFVRVVEQIAVRPSVGRADSCIGMLFLAEHVVADTSDQCRAKGADGFPGFAASCLLM